MREKCSWTVPKETGTRHSRALHIQVFISSEEGGITNKKMETTIPLRPGALAQFTVARKTCIPVLNLNQVTGSLEPLFFIIYYCAV